MQILKTTIILLLVLTSCSQNKESLDFENVKTHFVGAKRTIDIRYLNAKILYADETWESNSGKELQALAEFLKANPKYRIEIGVHTDQRGDDNANERLSNVRADYIKWTLKTKFNCDTSNIITRGYGERFPIYTEETIAKQKTQQEKEELYQTNIRTEIILLEKNYPQQ